MIIAKCTPFKIIGAEEVMLNAKSRFVTATVVSKTATMFRVTKSELRKLITSGPSKL